MVSSRFLMVYYIVIYVHIKKSAGFWLACAFGLCLLVILVLEYKSKGIAHVLKI